MYLNFIGIANIFIGWKGIKWHKYNILHHRELLEEILENAQATGEAAFSLSTSIIDIDTIHDSNIDPQLLQIDTQSKASAV